MLHRIAYLIVFCCFLTLAGLRADGTMVNQKQDTGKGWNISATASTTVEWALDLVLAEYPSISARILSVNEGGCFIDAGSQDGVSVGQVYEIYRVQHNGGQEEIAGEVQVAWTREDYSFAEPRGWTSIEDLSTLHFARLIRLPSTVSLISNPSEGFAGPDLDRLLQAVHGLLSVRASVRPVLGISSEPSWKLTFTPDFEGLTIRIAINAPGGETVSNIMLDPLSGEVFTARNLLDPSYLTGESSPFEHYIAPPGRRVVSIACGNIVPGLADELVVLDGSNLWIYDLSWDEPRLLNSLTISIPPGPVRHRDDGGALQLVDLDGNSLAEICLAPPGGVRGEIWSLSGDEWILLGYLPYPPVAVDTHSRGVLVAPYMINSNSLDPSLVSWRYPLSERESSRLYMNFSPSDIAVIPETKAGFPSLAAINIDGVLSILPHSGGIEILDGVWGTQVEIAIHRNSPIAILTSPSIVSDKLTLLELYSGIILAEFPVPNGPVIDIALGDIDRDGKSEILVAVLEEEGVKIYY